MPQKEGRDLISFISITGHPRSRELAVRNSQVRLSCKQERAAAQTLGQAAQRGNAGLAAIWQRLEVLEPSVTEIFYQQSILFLFLAIATLPQKNAPGVS